MAYLSVIVPVYNTEVYLDECVSSILNQTLKDIEVILIDDGSTDNSGTICDKYQRKDARVIAVHTKNQGMIRARREGLMRSHSFYVTFVDSDDFLDVHAYEYALQDMKNLVDVICFGIRRYREDGENINQHNYFPVKTYYDEEIKKEIFPHLIWPAGENIDPSLCTKLFKREILLEQYERIKDLRIDYAEDAITIYPILKKIHSLTIKGEIFYNHRQTVKTEAKYYILDEAYYDKVYKMYAYMKSEFFGIPIVLEQIEKHFVRSVNHRRVQLDNWRITEADVEKIVSYKNLIIYGAGQIAKKAIPYLSQLGINRFSIAVSEPEWQEYLYGNKVWAIRDIDCRKEETMVLIAVSKRKQQEINNLLQKLGWTNVISII